jgi:hypothetical protein
MAAVAAISFDQKRRRIGSNAAKPGSHAAAWLYKIAGWFSIR